MRFTDNKGKRRDVLTIVTMIPGTAMSVASLLDITEHNRTLETVKVQQQQLADESRQLRETNTSLKVLLKHREEDRQDLEKRLLANVRRLLAPFIEKLKQEKLTETQAARFQEMT